MAQIVLAELDKLDFRTTFAKHTVIESIDEIASDNAETYVIDYAESDLQAVENAEAQVYIPATDLKDEHQNRDVHIYFDLENHSFFQKAKNIIEQEAKPKGVFRFHRVVKTANKDELITGDLFVMSRLLGDPEDVQVRATNPSTTPSHFILMINFGGGTMAHMEYTFIETDEEKIEFEWSGVKNIIDFNSETFKPIQPDNTRNLALVYPLDAIIASAHKVDAKLIDQIKNIKELISGGAK